MTPPRLSATTRTAMMQTRFGAVEIHAFDWPDEPPYAVVRNPVRASPVHLRLQAQCVTSTALGAQMCDCGEQVAGGVRMAATVAGGMFIYLPQEGRGHGLLSKVEVMAAMNTGLGLREAQYAVGRPESALSYRRVPEILDRLEPGIRIVLVTGSSEKAKAVADVGVAVAGLANLGV